MTETYTIVRPGSLSPQLRERIVIDWVQFLVDNPTATRSEKEHASERIAAVWNVKAGQLAAIKAHVTMGTYGTMEELVKTHKIKKTKLAVKKA